MLLESRGNSVIMYLFSLPLFLFPLTSLPLTCWLGRILIVALSDGWIHSTLYYTDEIDVFINYTYSQPRRKRTPHTPQGHTRVAVGNNQEQWKASFIISRGWGTFVPLGGCDWPVWIIPQAGRKVKPSTREKGGTDHFDRKVVWLEDLIWGAK